MAHYGPMGSIGMYAANMPPIPLYPRPSRSQRKQLQQQKKEREEQQDEQDQELQQQQPQHHQQRLRSGSASTAAVNKQQRHSRTSSGGQASSHDTAALQTDRPAATSSSSGNNSTAVGPHQRRHQHDRDGHHYPQQPSASTAASKPAHYMLRSHLADGLHPFDARNAVYLLQDRDPNKTSVTSAERAAGSASSISGAASLSARTMTSTDPSAASDNPIASRPFVLRNGRTYLNDPNLPYPLPSDLTELHRQSLRTLLLIQVFGAPVCSPSLTKKPPQKVLEIGCGSGFWSMMCHRYFKGRGHNDISFTGIDIAPLAPGSANIAADAIKPDRDMNWKFVHHDLRSRPWPLPDEEYDLVMAKDMSLATTNTELQDYIDEYLRLLRPGGTLEVWESDHLIRMLRPHVPGAATAGDDADDQEAASSLGAYVMSANTPLSAPQNTYLVEYNHWLSRALDGRDLSAVPCTRMGPVLLQEAEILAKVRSRRLAIPLSEVRWEREGVGGTITRDGKSYVKAEGKPPHHMVEKMTLSSGQSALRKTALLTVVQQVQALEPILREASGKSQDEWDVWLGKMMGDLMSESGTTWGECLEIGGWWAKKKKKDDD